MDIAQSIKIYEEAYKKLVEEGKQVSIQEYREMLKRFLELHHVLSNYIETDVRRVIAKICL